MKCRFYFLLSTILSLFLNHSVFAHGGEADLLLMEKSFGQTTNIETYRFDEENLLADRFTAREWKFLMEPEGESCYRIFRALHLSSRNPQGIQGLVGNNQAFQDASLSMRIIPFPQWGYNLGKWDAEAGEVVPVNHGEMVLISKLGGNEIALADGSDCESDDQFLSSTKDAATSIDLDLSFLMYGSGVEDCSVGERSEGGVYVIAVQFTAEHLTDEGIMYTPSFPMMIMFYDEAHVDEAADVSSWLSRNALLSCRADCNREFKTADCEYPIGPELCFDEIDNDQDGFVDDGDDECAPDEPVIEEPIEQTGGMNMGSAGEAEPGPIEENIGGEISGTDNVGGQPGIEENEQTGGTGQEVPQPLGGAQSDGEVSDEKRKTTNSGCQVQKGSLQTSGWVLMTFFVLFFVFKVFGNSFLEKG